LAPWWLRASNDEQLADSPGELEAFAHEEDPILGTLPQEAGSPASMPAKGQVGEQADADEDQSEEDEANEEQAAADEDDKSVTTRRRRRRRRRRVDADSPAAGEADADTAQEKHAHSSAPAAAEPPAKVESAPAANEPKAPSKPAPAPAAPAPAAPAPAAPKAAPAPPTALAPAPRRSPARSPRPQREPEPPSRRDNFTYSPPDLSSIPSEAIQKAFVYTVPERPSSPADERKIAMFVDFENIALGVRDSEVRTFDITLILERLLEKGKIIVKKAYADWERYSEYKRPFHEAAIELIDIPQKFYSGKNSADIKMVVDAMDLCYSKEHLDTFVLVSGDSDFSPLVSKLKENNKYVIGLGVKNSSSNLLIDNCDEFIYYEDVWRDTQRVPRLDHLAPKEAECFQLMCESIVALLRENKDVLWGSLVKQTMQRKRPSFSEGYFGYATFTELLEDAERKNIIRLRRDQRSGTYIVVGFVPPRSKRSSFQV